MSAEYKESPSVAGMVEHVIQTTPAHNHLRIGQPNIVSLLRIGDWYSKGKIVFAAMDKVSDKVKAVTGYEWILTVNERVWDALDEPRRRALVDEQISKIEWATTEYGERKVGPDDRPVWTKADYDFHGFIGVIQRHGLWNHDLRRFFEGTKEYVQEQLFDKAPVRLTTSVERLEKEKAEPKPVEDVYEISFENGRPVFKRKDDEEEQGAA